MAPIGRKNILGQKAASFTWPCFCEEPPGAYSSRCMWKVWVMPSFGST